MRLFSTFVVCLASAAFAAGAPENFDAFTASPPSTALPSAANDVPGHVAHVEQRLGVPTFFWAAPSTAPRSFRDQGLTPEQAARRYLLAHAALYRTDAVSLAESPVVRLHDAGQGAIIVSFEKRLGGVPVFRDRLHVVMNQRLELVALTGYLSPHAAPRATFKLAANTALATALLDLSGAAVDPRDFRDGSIDDAGYRRVSLAARGDVGRFEGRVKKVLFGLPERLVPAWLLELDVGQGSTDSDVFSYVVSAEDGALLFRKNLTESDQYTYRVWAETSGLHLPHDGPQGIDPSPHPTGSPNGYSPAFIAPSLVTLQNGPISTNDPWLPSMATETTGNNAEAYADLASPDGFGAGDLRANTRTASTFDYTYDPSLAPAVSQDQQKAAITQLFYTVNFLHDWFYDRGFNESAGNAQADNLGRGGAAGDSIKAEAQDSSGTNNANMSTPADGSRPRMQMYLWTPRAPANVTAPSLMANWNAGTASFGPNAFSVTGDAILAADATAPASDACTAITNNVAGRIAVIDRGSCSFAVKTANAQAAGAIGVIIVNNAAGAAPGMSGTDPTITTPVLSLSQADGTALKTAIAAGTVSVTLTRVAAVNRDGDVDNTIIAHEWGHYLSNRLIADAAGLSNQQGRGMGEGWGDFISMLLMVRAQDAMVASNANFNGVYAAAAYSLGGPGTTNESFYFGIRRFPYSTDFTKNALTFRHIQDGVALPTGMPMSPAAAANSEVHNTGEIWASMLWECYAELLRATSRLTFDQARDRMMRYLVASLKLTPASPTFIEARDAVLAAAYAGDAADFQAFARAFARRGAGLHAVAPDRASSTNTPVVEDFTTGNELSFVKAELDDEGLYCDRDGVLDVGERGRLRVTLKNVGLNGLTATTATITSTTPGVTIVTPTLTFPSSLPFAPTTAQTEIVLTGLTAPAVVNFEISFTDPALMAMAPRTATASFRVHSDSIAAASATDDAEASILAWTLQRNATLSTRFNWAKASLAPNQNVFFGVDPSSTADISLVSPPLQVAATGSFSFTLSHRWDFEASGGVNYDGAVIEVSTDNGTTWNDVGATAAGYTGTLGGTGSSNPLLSRQAYTGRSTGYPSMTTTTVDLGTAYAGQTVQVRFRIGGDQATAGAGWFIDSVAFSGITNTPFPTLVADRGQCINRPPVANAGPDLVVDERSMVTLDSSRSTDPDNDPLSARWVQTGGPMVTVTSGAFVAPEVTADTELRFDLIVNDGTVDSPPDSLSVMVRQVNRAPVADAGADQSVDERTLVTLAGTGMDPDGESLTFAWTQVSGPTVALSDATAAAATFTAPEVTADSTVVLALVASDGTAQSAPAQVAILVRQVNRAPTVQLAPEASYPERATATLLADAVDPDGDELTFTWRQTSGPPVTLRGASTATVSFTAPEVTADAPIGLEVVVSDGQLDATASATLRVADVNRPPVANAGSSREVEPGSLVTLDGSNSADPDGDPLLFKWTQVGGDAVTLAGADTAKATFTAPAEKKGLSFQLQVTDGHDRFDQAEVQIVVIGRTQGCGCSSPGDAFGPAIGLLALAIVARRRRRAV